MSSPRVVRLWPWILLALAGLTVLYAAPLGTRFLNDDYLFLEEARSRSLGRALTELGALGNYYRPLSRQIYFETLTHLGGENPLVFHLVNYGLYLGALALLLDLLLALLPLAGAVAGALYFALLPLTRVLLIWVSCSQDLLALVGVLGALALYRRGRLGLALLPAAAALASKEAALPLPAALAAWDLAIGRLDRRATIRRVLPFALLSLLWACVALAMRRSTASAPLAFDASHFAAGYAHLLQSLLGMDHPPGLVAALAANAPSLLPLVAIVPLLFAIEPPGVAAPPAPGVPLRALAGLAVAWLAAFGLVVGPAADSWSGYYYTSAAVGAAIGVGALCRNARALGLLGVLVALLWLNAAGAGTRAFAVAQRPWGWTSHLTSFYFERAAALTDSMSRQLREAEPAPPGDARMFFAALPPFAGFQMGNGALVRALYRRPGIESHFYSQFSESTAAGHPCRFFYWNGERLDPMYRKAADPFFQVGSDLLLLGRTDGAVYAFRRGLATGESRLDHLYWLGWAELWSGRRDAAEASWTQLGFRDDSLRWLAHLRAAHNALTDGDSILSRQHLITAVQYGVGRPEAHAVLGELLAGDHLKYALLELKVATWLNPRDWLARRELVRGLVEVRLDDAARRELAELRPIDPGWSNDSTVVRAARDLDARAPAAGDVVEF